MRAVHAHDLIANDVAVLHGHELDDQARVEREDGELVAGSGIEFKDREHQLKGISEAWRLFAVVRDQLVRASP